MARPTAERNRRDESVVSLVMKVMADGKPRTAREIADECNARRPKADPKIDWVTRAVKDLFDRGELARSGAGKNKAIVYCLPQPKDPDEVSWDDFDVMRPPKKVDGRKAAARA